jgi:hypothetical protein
MASLVRARMSFAHPWHQAILENNFELCTGVIPANAGIQEELGPRVRRDDENVPFGKNFREML